MCREGAWGLRFDVEKDIKMAESERFELSKQVSPYTRFPGVLLQPLGQLSTMLYYQKLFNFVALPRDCRLESVYTGKPVSRVRISHSPPFLYPFSGRAAAPGSCAMGPREPRQVRKEAALSESFHVPRGCLGTAVRRGKGWRAARNGCFFTIYYCYCSWK